MILVKVMHYTFLAMDADSLLWLSSGWGGGENGQYDCGTVAVPTYWTPFYWKSSPRVVIKCFIRVAAEPFTHAAQTICLTQSNFHILEKTCVIQSPFLMWLHSLCSSTIMMIRLFHQTKSANLTFGDSISKQASCFCKFLVLVSFWANHLKQPFILKKNTFLF